MRDVSFTEEEANVLISLLDIAVKSDGLKIAGNAMVLVQKLQQAFSDDGSEIASGPELPGEEKPKKK